MRRAKRGFERQVTRDDKKDDMADRHQEDLEAFDSVKGARVTAASHRLPCSVILRGGEVGTWGSAVLYYLNGCNLIKDQDTLEGEVEQAFARDEIYYS